MSTTRTSLPTAPALTWKQASDDIHVATRDGEFAGFVEVHPRRFLAHDSRGTALGSFPTLPDARRALEGRPPTEPPKARFAYARRRIRRALA